MVLTENRWKDDRYSMRLDISWRTSSPKRGQKKEETKRSGSPSLGFSSEQGGQENLIARDSRFEVAPPMFSAISTRYHYGIASFRDIFSSDSFTGSTGHSIQSLSIRINTLSWNFSYFFTLSFKSSNFAKKKSEFFFFKRLL